MTDGMRKAAAEMAFKINSRANKPQRSYKNISAPRTIKQIRHAVSKRYDTTTMSDHEVQSLLPYVHAESYYEPENMLCVTQKTKKQREYEEMMVKLREKGIIDENGLLKPVPITIKIPREEDLDEGPSFRAAPENPTYIDWLAVERQVMRREGLNSIPNDVPRDPYSAAVSAAVGILQSLNSGPLNAPVRKGRMSAEQFEAYKRLMKLLQMKIDQFYRDNPFLGTKPELRFGPPRSSR